MALIENAEIVAIRGAEQAVKPSVPAAGYRKIFAKSTGWYDEDDAGVEQPIGANFTRVLGFGVPGVLATGTVAVRLHAPGSGTIINVTAAVTVAPTGAALIVDIHKNGTTVFTSQGDRPTIAAAATEDLTAVPAVTTFALDDVFTLDIDQIGVTVPGSNLLVQIRYTPS